jgi:hypothetical protein
MVSRTSSRFNRKRFSRRSDKPFTVQGLIDYLADHQIGMNELTGLILCLSLNAMSNANLSFAR